MKEVSRLRATIELMLVTFFLQVGVFSLFIPDGWIPQISVLYVLFLGFYEPSLISAIAVFVLGLLIDMSAGSLLGPSSASLLVTHLFVGLSSKRLFLESSISAIVFGACAAVSAASIRYILISQFVPHDYLIPLLKEVSATALCAPFMLWLFRFRLGRRKGI